MKSANDCKLVLVWIHPSEKTREILKKFLRNFIAHKFWGFKPSWKIQDKHQTWKSLLKVELRILVHRKDQNHQQSTTTLNRNFIEINLRKFHSTLKSSTLVPEGEWKRFCDVIPVAVFDFGWGASFLMIQVTWRLSCEFWTPIRWLIFIIYRTWIFWLNVQFAQGTNPLWV